MFDLPMKFPAGKLVVFEGMDDTGKSTQLERFESMCYTPDHGDAVYKPKPFFTHQPSGATGIGPDIYELTESVDWSQSHPLTRQLLHLAAHNEHYHHDILPTLSKKSVVMDRCWWSTVAYGYRDAIAEQMEWDEFIAIAQLPTQGVMPDLVFLFTHRYGKKTSDRRTSTDRITMTNYLRLQEQFADTTLIVPDHNKGEVTAFISGQLHARGLTHTTEVH